MAMPTAVEAVSMYLFGQKYPPADLKTDALIRPLGKGTDPLIVDKNEYMTTGGGRFVKVENFRYVRNFLAATDYPGVSLAPGVYTRDQLLQAYQKEGKLSAWQYYLGVQDDDYSDRAYVFGSTDFEIVPDAKFIVNPDGSREIVDIAVQPMADNFDYESSNAVAAITNWLTKDRIDPSGIGRTVPIEFSGTVLNRQVLTGEDWFALETANKLSELGKLLDADPSNLPSAILDFALVLKRLVTSGVIDYKDPDGRFVYYDGAAPGNNGTLNAADGLGKVQYRGAIYDGAVALLGGDGNDVLNATKKSDELFGGAGHDTLSASSGDDLLDGGAGNDKLFAGEGNDTLHGGEDDDVLSGEDGNDLLQAGIGNDTLQGGSGNDTLFGGSDDDVLQGDGGNDVLYGGSGNDTLQGGDANDMLSGGAGADLIFGGKGNDILLDEGGSESTFLSGDDGNDVLEVKGGVGYAMLYGGADTDILLGGGGGSFLDGGTGNDSIIGGSSADDVFGGENADYVDAGAGDDWVIGGKGADYLKGGAGNDTYVYEGRDFGVDLIEDSAGGDVILADEASLGTANYDADKLAWIGANGMEIRKHDVGGSITLAVSYAGDKLNTIYLRDWSAGRYGITLTGEPQERQRPEVALAASRAIALNNFVDNWYGDAIDGGEGNDVLGGTGAQSVISGGNGNDLIDSRGGDDWVEGGAGNDVIYTGEGRDVAYGGGGDDLMQAGIDFEVQRTTDKRIFWPPQGAFDDVWWFYTLSGSSDTDRSFRYYVEGGGTFEIAHPEYAVFDLQFATEPVTNPTYSGKLWWYNSDSPDASLEPSVKFTITVGDIELGDDKHLQYDNILQQPLGSNIGKPITLEVMQPHGGKLLRAGANTEGVRFFGGDGNDVIYGANNNDKLLGEADDDLLIGYDGDDELDGGDGRDELSGGAGRDFLQGGKGDDHLIGGFGADVLYGGDGNDKLYGDAVNLYPTNSYPAALDTSRMGGDYLVGGVGNDSLWGNHGDDYLFGGVGDDAISGGDDNDHGFGEAGVDLMWGGKGDDYLDGGTENDQVDGGEGNDMLLGGAGEDNLTGATGDDILDGGANNDLLFGGDGHDNLRGGEGDDKLYGDGGESTDGNDVLEGGAGNDELAGGGGSDLYVFSTGDGRDIVRDDGAGGSRNVIAFKFGSGAVRMLARDGTDLLIQYGQSDQVRVVGYYLGSHFSLGSSNDSAPGEDSTADSDGAVEIRFEDGTVWGQDEIFRQAPPPPVGEVPPDPFAALEPLYFINALISRETIKAAGKHALTFSLTSAIPQGVTGAYSFTEEQKQAVRQALAEFSKVLNLTFTETYSSTADLHFYLDDLTSAGLGGFAGYAEPASGEVHLNSTFYSKTRRDEFGNVAAPRSLNVGTAGFEVLLHEIGHALGLKHPFEPPVLPNAENNNANTVMSYTRPGGPATQLAPFDIAALQFLYGVNARIDSLYGSHSFAERWIQDGVGYDRFDASAETQDVYVDLTPGSWIYKGSKASSILAENQAFIGFGTEIEAARGGSGNDTLIGGSRYNYLEGGSGDDVLRGGAGEDTLVGGAGSDTYVWAPGSEVETVLEDFYNEGGGVDIVRVIGGVKPADVQLTRLYNDLVLRHGNDRMVIQGHFSATSIDAVVFDDGSRWDAATIRANVTTGMTEFADVYAGTDEDDRVDGYGGNDQLNGLNGADQFNGGAGDDTLLGDAGNDSLTGGDGNDSLLGGSGDDLLAEGEVMDGGTGSDTYRWGSASSVAVIIEQIAEPGDVDTLRLSPGVLPSDLRFSRVNADLRVWTRDGEAGLVLTGYFDGGLIERFVFEDGTVWDASAIAAAIASNPILPPEGTAGDDVLPLSPFDDQFSAGAGDDRIDGKTGNDRVEGGAGRDTLFGGLGDDSLEGGNDDDQLSGGTGKDVLDGGGGANLLDGGDGNDRLSSHTRGARDTMLGGEGEDTYSLAYGTTADVTSSAVDSSTQSNDVYIAVPFDGVTSEEVGQTWAIDDAGGQSDELRITGQTVTATSTVIRSTGTGFSLTAANLKVVIEHALTEAGTAGVGAIERVTLGDGTTYTFEQLVSESLRFTAGDDSIVGFGGDDTLDGGAGNDTLVGGRGSDTYRFNRGAGQDVVSDVLGDNDRIEFGPDITAADLSVERSGSDLLVKINGTVDSLRLIDWAVGSNLRIEQFKFASGSVLSADQLVRSTDKGILGDEADNTLVGDAGPNQFNGPMFIGAASWTRTYDPHAVASTLRGGRDTMIGGAGDDVYFTNSVNGEGNPYIGSASSIGYANEVIVELAGEGHDTEVTTAYHAKLADNVEDLISYNRQSYYNPSDRVDIPHVYTGNALDNLIDARKVEDAVRLDGGIGADTMVGRPDGVNTYVVDNAGDVILNEVGPGDMFIADVVEASISYALTDVVENLVLTGSSGTVGTGNAKNNVIDGSLNEAANTLIGGLGDDTYRVDASDVVVEQAGEGNDTIVITSAGTRTTVALDPAGSVERLMLDEAAGAINIAGNDLNESLQGNSANNVILGAGGDDSIRDGDYWFSNGRATGTDTIDGGAGDDVIFSAGGNDLITGGIGNDAITFDMNGVQDRRARLIVNRGDGVDSVRITDSDARVEVQYGAGIEVSELVFTRQANDLRVQLGASNDALVFRDVFATENPIGFVPSRLSFADGFQITAAQLKSRYSAGNANVVTESGDLLLGGIAPNQLAGLGGDDVIWAGAGDDDLSGGQGDDLLVGGLGNDLYRFNLGDGSDVVTDADGVDMMLFGAGLDETGMQVLREGQDLIVSFGIDQITIRGGGSSESASAIEGVRFADGTVRDLAHLLSIAVTRGDENGDDEMTGTEGNDRLDGRGGYDTLLGLGGDDWLSGGEWGEDLLDGGTGIDTMIGGDENDTYIVDSAADLVIELEDHGTDVVRASASYVLSNNVEKIVLTGTASISATGNALNNTLDGNAGANRLDGGSGADTMKGYAGDDVYVVDNASDVITENANEGTDTVETSFAWTLRTNFENLTLTGSASVNGTGTSVNNALVGNTGNNILDGLAGADTMRGGAGDDVYKVDNASDVIVETANAGMDRVDSTVTYTLSSDVEQLMLLGTGNLNGTGNASANTLSGTSGANRLDGGAGADTLTGGAGNDTYVVDNVLDITVEAASGGTDTVESSVTWTLASETENLTLTGTASVGGTGNAVNNTIRGNTGANALSGAAGNDSLVGGAGDDTLDGGIGTDTLVGGAGNDTFVVDVTTDVITEVAGEGTDTVVTAVTLTLGSTLENVTLSGSSGIGATGNASANVMIGNAGANALSGAAGNDTLDGAGGNDTLTGGAGADGYVFGRSYGSDTIVENDATTGVKDFVSFGANIAKGDITFQKSGNALLAKVNGTSDVLTLQDWYLGTKYHVEEFRFKDGTVLTDTQAQALVSAMAAFSPSATTSSLTPASDTPQRMPSVSVSEPHRHVSF